MESQQLLTVTNLIGFLKQVESDGYGDLPVAITTQAGLIMPVEGILSVRIEHGAHGPYLSKEERGEANAIAFQMPFGVPRSFWKDVLAK